MTDDKFNRLDTKLDKVMERVGSIDVTLAAQHVSLTDHIRRTEILENAIVPIQEQVVAVDTTTKLIGAVIGLAAGAASIIEIFSYFK